MPSPPASAASPAKPVGQAAKPRPRPGGAADAGGSRAAPRSQGRKDPKEPPLGSIVSESMERCSSDLAEALTALQTAFTAQERSTQDLRAELERMRDENESLRSELEEAREEAAAAASPLRQSSRGPSFRQSSRCDSDFADEVWEPLERMLEQVSGAAALPEALPVCNMPGENKFMAEPKFFVFGDTREFLGGLSGLSGSALVRSMEEECRDNDNGLWWPEYEYVVRSEAEENVGLDSSIFVGTRSIAGVEIVRDHGHAGMRLADFCATPQAREADLTFAEVAALRLYSGPLFVPINRALRRQQVEDWATTIACCYSGVLKLSFLSQPTRVYRGVRETDAKLPPEFLQSESGDGGFAGGVERAFMSTSTSPAVALDYSGGVEGEGAIFVIDFDMTSRGASIQWLSQYPHEEELLFPPCTGLTCCGVEQRGNKRCVLLSAQVSTARPDTRDLVSPEYVPGTGDALKWVAELRRPLELATEVAALASRAHWDLTEKNCAAHAAKLGLLFGRAAHAAPALRSLDLTSCQLQERCAEELAAALSVAPLLAKLNLRCNDLGPAGGMALATAMRTNTALTHLDLSANYIGPDFSRVVHELCSGNRTLQTLVLDDNRCTNPTAEIATGLCANTSLTSLSLVNNVMTGAFLGDAIRGNTGLLRLFVQKCGLGDEGAVAVGEALEHNGTLRELTLDSNGIRDDGTKAIATALTVNCTLSKLSMRENKMGPKGGKALAEALPSNATLVKLDLSKNAIGDWAKNLLKKVNERARGLQKMKLTAAADEQPAAGGELREASFKAPERQALQVVL